MLCKMYKAYEGVSFFILELKILMAITELTH
jgi:hypothetical protein